MLRVMVFDKDHNDLQLFKKCIEEIRDIEIVGCYIDPIQGFDELKETVVDVIFTDIEMPVMFGIQLAEKVKEWDEEIAVVFTTDVMLYAIRAFDVGAFDYIIKPVKKSRIKKTIDRLRDGKIRVEE